MRKLRLGEECGIVVESTALESAYGIQLSLFIHHEARSVKQGDFEGFQWKSDIRFPV